MAAERIALQRGALAHQPQRRARGLSLAWPLLHANTQLCGEKTTRGAGLVLTTPASAMRLAKGLRRSDVLAAGHPNGVMAAALADGAPAMRAGLRQGDQILAVNGESLPPDISDKRLGKLMSKALKTDAPVRLLAAHDKTPPEEIFIEPETICDFSVAVGQSSAINAYTDGKSLVVLPGLERALGDDDEALRYVLAHELAHAILRHPRKLRRNAIVSGGAVLGPLASLGGAIADAGYALAGAQRPIKLRKAGSALVTYPYGAEFEREADYVGLYLHARAGGRLEGLEDLYTLFSREHPANTWLSISHPTAPERRVAVMAIRDEIEAKQAADEPLIPEGFEALSR